ncbi:MAG: ankyrin repeat domain-containing protein [Pseudomonadota bacterium]
MKKEKFKNELINYYIGKWRGDELGNMSIVPHFKFDKFDFLDLTKDQVDYLVFVKNNNIEEMEKRISKKPYMELKSSFGVTPLMIAVDYGNIEAAKLLLRWKTDVSAREIVDMELGGLGVTAMNLACRNKDLSMIDLLINHGGDINERSGINGESPFLIAVLSDDYEFINFILGKGADINIEFYDGETSLIYAVLKNDRKLAKYLLANGADVNFKNITGLTALDIARSWDVPAMEKILIEAGGDSEVRMLENLGLHAQDYYYVDNDIAYAYYEWTTDDGWLHILVYGFGYPNTSSAMSELRRFYIRKNADGILETFAGNDSEWFHHCRYESEELVEERFDSLGRNLQTYIHLPFGPDFAGPLPRTVCRIKPENCEGQDFESMFGYLHKYLSRFVSLQIGELDPESETTSFQNEYFCYTERGLKFLDQYYWRRSVNVKDGHESLVLDLLTQYFKY